MADHPHIQRRFEIVEQLLRGKAEIFQYKAQGRHILERFFSLIYTGDWLSYFMALARGVDPTPVITIERLKRDLGS